MFLWLRAAGEEPIVQLTWVYEHPCDLDTVRRVFDTGARGAIARLRIERSPLPFGRHRWVLYDGPQPEMRIDERTRPRAELSDWLDERAQLPVDPEHGPSFHLGVSTFTDGATAICVVMSHCLVDGLGGLSALSDAINGSMRDFGYPPPRSRTRRRALANDARETLRGAPEVGRALVAAAKLGFRQRHNISRSGAAKPAPISADGTDELVIVPAITMFVDLGDFDARAEALGGTSYTLIAGIAAKLGERMGRRRASDGAVTLIIPTSDRTEDDDRANAESLSQISIDPTRVTTDLSEVRRTIRQGLKKERDTPNEALQLLPLIPFIPKRVVKRGGDLIFGFAADLPVSCSILGDLDPALNRLDGTDAEYVLLRGVDRHITRRGLEQKRGMLTLVAGRIGGKVSISVVAYQPGVANSKPLLRELAAKTLADFGLTGVID